MLKKISTFTLLGLCIAQSAHAEMDGFYASAQLGYVNTHVDTSDLVSINNGTSFIGLPDLNNWNLGYRLSFGYQLNKNTAVEIGYRRFGSTDINIGGANYFASASSQEKAFDLMAKGMLPITQALSVFGKVRIAYVKANSQGYANTAGTYTAFTNSYSNSLQPALALGVSYALKPNVPIDFSWNRIQKIGGGSEPPSSDFYALGVSYYFG